MGHTFLNVHGDAVRIDAPADTTSPVKLTDEAGHEIGTAVAAEPAIPLNGLGVPPDLLTGGRGGAR